MPAISDGTVLTCPTKGHTSKARCNSEPFTRSTKKLRRVAFMSGITASEKVMAASASTARSRLGTL